MKQLLVIIFRTTIVLALSNPVQAFPPAPYHEIYGTIRDSKGNPLSADAIVILNSAEREISRTIRDPGIAPGINYALKISMDAQSTPILFEPTAMSPSMPFTMSVQIGSQSYVPIEIQGSAKLLGEPGKRTRLDLTLGIDSDGDGLPDNWEEDLIASRSDDNIETLTDVRPGDDSDGDGLSNYQEYIAGTYAFDRSDALVLEWVSIGDEVGAFKFLAITGRAYSLQVSDTDGSFGTIPFSLEPGGEPRSSFVASEVRLQELYISLPEPPQKLFRLHVQ